ncbi:MAG: glutamate--tRNA ligase [Candidatus Pacearchaeota archaeon]|nr:glutamate--tRNA ligase [Candidatus Pacearchaeota archaeon]
MRDFSKEIRAYALKNAIEFGKADASKVLTKLFQHGLEKNEIKDVMKNIQEIVKEINLMDSEKRKKEFDLWKEYMRERIEKPRELPDLPNVSNNMVFRLAPFPSGALHIGNAKTYLLNALYAEKYNSKILLVMDDTIGSEEKQIIPEAYDLLEEAFDWLGVKYQKPIIYKSDRLNIYYEYGEKLLRFGKAYVCSCNVEELRKNRAEGKECNCRILSVEENIKRWKEMFNAKEGKYVVRIKTSMQHENPAFRDRVLFKISDRKHPRVGNKYRVWPTLEMSWAIDDYLLGITHILRGNDLMIETEMEKFIWDIFGWKHPITIHTGMIRIEGTEAKISKSKAQKEVKSGKFIGWDDPRTWSIQSLRRRGILKEAIREFVKEIGLNKQDIIVPIESLYAINRKLIDLKADRYSFVIKPKELKIENMPEIKEIEVSVHPDRVNEKRKIKIGKKLFIGGEDYKKFKNKEVRLIHLFNVKLGNKVKFVSEENKEIPKINWVSKNVKAKIMMPNGKFEEGIAEEAIKRLKKDEIIQFERFGFVRFDGIKNKVYEFWFSHK